MLDASSISRSKSLIKELAIQSAVLDLEGNIETKIKQNLDDTQKEYILKEKLKIIKNELGEAASREEEILDLIKENQKKKSFLPRKEIIRKEYLEDSTVNIKEKTLIMDVNIPKVSVNLKIGSTNASNEEIEIKKLALIYLIYQEFRSSSEFYRQLLKEEIIDDSFNYYVVLDKAFGYVSIVSNTQKIDEFISKVKEHLLSLKTIEISKEHFNKYLKINKARNIRKMDFIDSIVEMHVDAFIDNIEFFDELDIINKLKYEDVLDVRKYFNEDSFTTVIIKNEE
jgi:hypothetical protein